MVGPPPSQKPGASAGRPPDIAHSQSGAPPSTTPSDLVSPPASQVPQTTPAGLQQGTPSSGDSLTIGETPHKLPPVSNVRATYATSHPSLERPIDLIEASPSVGRASRKKEKEAKKEEPKEEAPKEEEAGPAPAVVAGMSS